MSDDVRGVIRDEIATAAQRTLVSGAVVILVLLFALGGALPLQGKNVGPGMLWVFLLVIGIPVAIIAAASLRDVADLRRDLRADTYERTVGDVSAGEESDYGYFYMLAVDGQQLRSPWHRHREPPFSYLPGATVDHTTHARVVLAIRDADGRFAYCAPGYGPMV